jgi:hypothetical protein
MLKRIAEADQYPRLEALESSQTWLCAIYSSDGTLLSSPSLSSTALASSSLSIIGSLSALLQEFYNSILVLIL